MKLRSEELERKLFVEQSEHKARVAKNLVKITRVGWSSRTRPWPGPLVNSMMPGIMGRESIPAKLSMECNSAY